MLTTHLYSSGTVTVPQTGIAFLPPHLMTTMSPGQTHLMDTKINDHEESHCLGHSDLNKMCELWVTVTSHPQVIVTLAWANNPTPEGLPHSKPGIHWVSRLLDYAQWWSPYTHPPSHPRDWICSPSPERTGTLLYTPVQTPYFLHTAPANLFLSFTSCFWAQHLTIQQLPWIISPQMLSLSTSWLHTTLQQQYIYEMILHVVWMKFLAPILIVLQPWYKYAAQ